MKDYKNAFGYRPRCARLEMEDYKVRRFIYRHDRALRVRLAKETIRTQSFV